MMQNLSDLRKKYPNLIIEILLGDVTITNGIEFDSPSMEFTLVNDQLTIEEIFDDTALLEFVDGYFFGQQLKEESR